MSVLRILPLSFVFFLIFVFNVVVLDVVAVVLRCEGCAVVGVGDAADAIAGMRIFWTFVEATCSA